MLLTLLLLLLMWLRGKQLWLLLGSLPDLCPTKPRCMSSSH
jgi:hypothetical protein